MNNHDNRRAISDQQDLQAFNRWVRQQERTGQTKGGEVFGVQYPPPIGMPYAYLHTGYARSTAVEMRHKETGIMVCSQVERSWTMNKHRCKEKLKAALAFHRFAGPSSLDVGLVRSYESVEEVEERC